MAGTIRKKIMKKKIKIADSCIRKKKLIREPLSENDCQLNFRVLLFFIGPFYLLSFPLHICLFPSSYLYLSFPFRVYLSVRNSIYSLLLLHFGRIFDFASFFVCCPSAITVVYVFMYFSIPFIHCRVLKWRENKINIHQHQ